MQFSAKSKKVVGVRSFSVHHAPTTKLEHEKFKLLSKDEVVNKVRLQYEIVFDLLGEETFVKWYQHYPEVYTKEKIKSLRIK
ncbi:hypothetical protein [Shewanella baltica]|uniref:hypothetical protein n=1 Tax=Shewanella baltica TaxID=62322 RepID=UPI000CA255A0|nr:hypothetical protein [Shewanella baltica]AUD60610.1 hypothetical protein AYJ58_14435 [Shewanella sp. Pdp11]